MSWSVMQWVAGGALSLVVLPGCSSAGGACAGVTAQMAETAVAGTTLSVRLGNLYATCPDTGQGQARQPSETVTLNARWAADPDRVVASASAPVSDGAAAEVNLPLPVSGSGLLLVKLDRQTLGQTATTYDQTLGQVRVSQG